MPQRKKRQASEPSVAALVTVTLASAAAVILVGGALMWWLTMGRGGQPAASGADGEGAGDATATIPSAGLAPAAGDATATAPSAGMAVATVVPQDPGTWLTADGFAGLGPTVAPVSMVVFLDYACPNSRQFAVEVMPWLRQTWLARGLVTLVLRDFAVLGERSVRAAMAAHCAGEQGRYVAYHDRLFAAQGSSREPFADENLIAYAKELGLDDEAFAACLSSERYRARVSASTRYGYDQGFEGTPTYVINGRRVAGAIETDRWNELFEAYAKDLATSTAAGP